MLDCMLINMVSIVLCKAVAMPLWGRVFQFEAVDDQVAMAAMFGKVACTEKADMMIKQAIITTCTAELLQAFRTKQNDKIGLRRIVQGRLRVLKEAGVETAALPTQLFNRCTAALQLR